MSSLCAVTKATATTRAAANRIAPHTKATWYPWMKASGKSSWAFSGLVGGWSVKYDVTAPANSVLSRAVPSEPPIYWEEFSTADATPAS